MTTPNPSRSVSPEPTKGETLGDARADAYMELRDLLHNSQEQGAPTRIELRALETFERAVRADAIAAYIPLVEAAEAVRKDRTNVGAMDGHIYCRRCDYAIEGGLCFPACTMNPLRAALVQVPGQQQADTGGV